MININRRIPTGCCAHTVIGTNCERKYFTRIVRRIRVTTMDRSGPPVGRREVYRRRRDRSERARRSAVLPRSGTFSAVSIITYSSDNRSRGGAPVARVFAAARRHRQVARRKRGGRARIRDIMAVSDVWPYCMSANSLVVGRRRPRFRARFAGDVTKAPRTGDWPTRPVRPTLDVDRRDDDDGRRRKHYLVVAASAGRATVAFCSTNRLARWPSTVRRVK